MMLLALRSAPLRSNIHVQASSLIALRIDALHNSPVRFAVGLVGPLLLSAVGAQLARGVDSGSLSHVFIRVLLGDL